uniref:Cytochrome P450 n=1 Tax=Anopheles maculatus TaxID=74869 RepID=A0A182S6B6_9DIPT
MEVNLVFVIGIVSLLVALMFGMFEILTPMFVIRDPELIKHITVKDFDRFINHRSLISADSANSEKSTVMFTKALFNLRSQKWRDVRTTLSPTFTGSKMRQMFTMIVECSENMVQALDNPAGQECEVKDLFIRFTNDVIASVAFGVRINSFRDRENVFFRYGKDLSNFSRFHVMLKMMGYQVFPKLMGWLQMDIFDPKHVEFFTNLFRQSVKEREHHGTVRPDLIHLLIQAGKGKLRSQPREDPEEVESFATAKESNEETILPKRTVTLSEGEMVAQCFLFFLAGFDTLATAISFLVYEVTIAAHIQERLYEEIREVSESLDGKSLT